MPSNDLSKVVLFKNIIFDEGRRVSGNPFARRQWFAAVAASAVMKFRGRWLRGSSRVETRTAAGRIPRIGNRQVIGMLGKMARETGLEPATSGVTGRIKVWDFKV
jgi:hypothetical protein